ncbi:MAG: hypothetical protein O3A00_29425, partial [Planctomycetota bacterium]|nr:hypothetical protein [Planctomycetota bacterium]
MKHYCFFNSAFAVNTVIAVLCPTTVIHADDVDRDQVAAIVSPSFIRDVAPLLSRLGCNAGSCHGAVQGQNGFRLSLFGANPREDFAQVVREAEGRRVNQVAPDRSLLLLKGTGRIPHVGGRRMKPLGREYLQLQRWIEAGCSLDESTVGQVTELVVTPASRTFSEGESFTLRVEARFADDALMDVTHLCSFESRDP